MRVVLDSNVVLAAFATRGLCHDLFETCLADHDVILSEELLDEIQRGLAKKVKVPPQVARELLAFLRSNTRLEVPARLDPSTCRDPDDLHVLGLLAASRCDFLITGDEDLLSLKGFQGVPILSPREFWNRLKGEKPNAASPPPRPGAGRPRTPRPSLLERRR